MRPFDGERWQVAAAAATRVYGRRIDVASATKNAAHPELGQRDISRDQYRFGNDGGGGSVRGNSNRGSVDALGGPSYHNITT